MIKKSKQALVLFLFFVISTVLFAKEDMVDHVALASLMIYDGKYDKAYEELSKVDKRSPKFDAAKYYTTLGVLYAKQNKSLEAIKAYKRAIEATKVTEFQAPKSNAKEEYLFSIASKQKSPKKDDRFDAQKKRKEKLEQLYIYLASEYYKIKDYKNTVASLDRAGKRGKDRPGLYKLRAECYYKLKEYHKSIEALNKGIERFKERSADLLKQKAYYLANLGLYQSAIAATKEYIKKVGDSAHEYILLAQMLLEANEIDSAIKILEEAKLKFPKSAKVSFLLGHLYLKKEMKLIAANLFEESAYYNKKYLNDAVEMNRRAGLQAHALYLNMQNSDKKQKLQQKIAIYLGTQEYRKIIGLKKALDRYGMLQNDNLRYALAYAYYMVGDYKAAERELKYISDSELFNKATVIRKNIEKCTNNSLECL
ncbi:MAG TPA: tetratricopeptide repeat protein [Sulfurimonas autotrophica]|nr:tetratricopeptide repeat protein [Sulfurimonas autotrophica]